MTAIAFTPEELVTLQAALAKSQISAESNIKTLATLNPESPTIDLYKQIADNCSNLRQKIVS